MAWVLEHSPLLLDNDLARRLQTTNPGLDGHICRCTSYVRYYTALREVILADPKLIR